MIRDILVTAGLVTAWALLHSITAAVWFKEWWQRRLGRKMAFYRLGYNLFALLSMAGAAAWIPWNGTVLYEIGSPFREGFFIIMAAAGGLLLYTLWKLGLDELSGVAPIRRYFAGTYEPDVRSESGIETGLVITGLYSFSRHPLYLFAAVLFIFVPRMTVGYAVFGAVGIAYMYVGSMFEERRLIGQYDEEYRRYQQRVARIIPWR